ncbi:hypothetical protein J3S90_02300 [Flavobacterium sp. P4023]|uniref:Uncharacterized protein n=1 Tax=Flavobacterium flabelliforme TaxID=2816119 RepID=A0ABS5CPT9_9FLAO|nr:hypothetical protein [Flavobacterium flabelliforme]MBP4140628.1 hypothetical protein [Flavobacterium flabelliforme]
MFSKEFKKALQELPSAEKDKLIFRLIKIDLDLANRLYFELVDIETIEEKRATFELLLSKKIKQITNRFYSIVFFYYKIYDM